MNSSRRLRSNSRPNSSVRAPVKFETLFQEPVPVLGWTLASEQKLQTYVQSHLSSGGECQVVGYAGSNDDSAPYSLNCNVGTPPTASANPHGSTTPVFPWMLQRRSESAEECSRHPAGDTAQGGNKSEGFKRPRTVYTREQLFHMEVEFRYNKYLCSTRRAQLANALNLSQQQVKVWFQNRRMKLKKESRRSCAASSPEQSTDDESQKSGDSGSPQGTLGSPQGIPESPQSTWECPINSTLQTDSGSMELEQVELVLYRFTVRCSGVLGDGKAQTLPTRVPLSVTQMLSTGRLAVVDGVDCTLKTSSIKSQRDDWRATAPCWTREAP
nr:homeobox protein Hox-A1-like [Rhipicephalus microplus]